MRLRVPYAKILEGNGQTKTKDKPKGKMTQEMERTTNQEMERTVNYSDEIEFLRWKNEDGKTINYCYEFKVTFDFNDSVNLSCFDGIIPHPKSLEKTFLKDCIFRYPDTWLELLENSLTEPQHKPTIKKTTNILTTEMKIVRSKTVPTKLEWCFRISDFFRVIGLNQFGSAHTKFLDSDNVKERLKTFLEITTFIDKRFVPNYFLGSPSSVEVIYNCSYVSNTVGPYGTD